jgi:hypothetical protein
MRPAESGPLFEVPMCISVIVRGIARYCPRNVWRMIRTTPTPTLTSIPTCAPVEKLLVVPFLEAASLVAVVSENEIGVDVVERAVVL